MSISCLHMRYNHANISIIHVQPIPASRYKSEGFTIDFIFDGLMLTSCAEKTFLRYSITGLFAEQLTG